MASESGTPDLMPSASAPITRRRAGFFSCRASTSKPRSNGIPARNKVPNCRVNAARSRSLTEANNGRWKSGLRRTTVARDAVSFPSSDASKRTGNNPCARSKVTA
jgi:hypothetical protein